MSSSAVRTVALPRSWFERPQYRPLVEVGGTKSWFALSPAVKPTTSLPAAPPETAPPSGTSRGARLEQVLEATYRDWRLPVSDAVRRSRTALTEPGTLVVVTGQQPGFLGGPLYTIYKALSAVALAACLEKHWQRRCVPLFWVAGDDHDLDEIREARFPGGESSETVFRLPHRAGRRPLSTLAVDEETERVLDAATEFFHPRRHGSLVRGLIDLYRGRNLASGFAAILSELLGHHGLLVLDPEKLRPFSTSLIKQLILAPEEALEKIEEGRRGLEERGLRPFVASRLPLFILRDGSRDHLSPTTGGLEVDGEGSVYDQSELLSLLEASPESFSPGALLRPIVQEALVPTAMTVGGAAEVGYYAQLGPLARWFGVNEPGIALRLQATLIEGKLRSSWIRAGLTAEKLARAMGPEDLVPTPPSIPALEKARALQHQARKVLAGLVEQLPPEASRRRLEKRAGKVVSSIEGILEHVEKARRQAHREHFDAASAIWHHVLPGDELQERRWGVFYYLAKYGSQWLDTLVEQLRVAPLELEHKLVFFEKE